MDWKHQFPPINIPNLLLSEVKRAKWLLRTQNSSSAYHFETDCPQFSLRLIIKKQKIVMSTINSPSSAWLCCLILVQATSGFYLPGLAPVSYCKPDESDGKCKVGILLKRYSI